MKSYRFTGMRVFIGPDIDTSTGSPVRYEFEAENDQVAQRMVAKFANDPEEVWHSTNLEETRAVELA